MNNMLDKMQQEVRSTNKNKSMDKMFKLLAILFDVYDGKSPPLLEIECFMVVAKNDGKLTQTEITQVLKRHCKSTTPAHVSRYLYSLGRGKINITQGEREEGRGLVETREDPTNYARKLAYLTEKGRKLADQIADLMGDDYERFAQR